MITLIKFFTFTGNQRIEEVGAFVRILKVLSIIQLDW